MDYMGGSVPDTALLRLRFYFCYVKQSKNLNVPFPRPFGATGNDARKLHAHGFARFRGVLSAHEVSCGVTAVSNKIICIAREFGSGGHEIAVRAGDKLGIKVYEKDIFHLACHYGGLSEQLMASADEAATNPLLYETVHEGNFNVIRGMPTSEVLFALQSHEIKRLAASESCIFVGHCADYVLRRADARLLRVFVTAPLEHRINRKMQQENLTRDRALRLISKMDKRRRKYYDFYTGQKWGDAGNYDLIVDTGEVSIQDAADCLCEMYRKL